MPQRIAGLGFINRLAIAAQRCFAAAAGSSEYEAFRRVIQQLLERISLEEVGLSEQILSQTEPGRIKYQHICENELFSMGIFVLGKGACIPIHDHPEMTVFSKVLGGNVNVRAFDWTHGSEQYIVDGQVIEDAWPARLHSEGMVRGPSPPRSLFATEGNLHTFTAVTPTAMLDVLGPPYDDGDRECHYYRLMPSLSANDQEVPEHASRTPSPSDSEKLQVQDSTPNGADCSNMDNGSIIYSNGLSPSDLSFSFSPPRRPNYDIFFLQRYTPELNIDTVEYHGELVSPELFNLVRPGEPIPPEVFLRNTTEQPEKHLKRLTLQ